ncbi:putative WRKY transcription factor 59 isoform X1 [Canna indica]|uniref:WRKY transcription factor 59 isoform X1 n=1 Tax=Canna indica TaxID=4628 RepID=A0AAQ3JT61_9LILI|nr:putative WRKY transcription factor 59 isoform X1 [Canna indica]
METDSLVVNAVIRELQQAQHLTAQLRSLVELGDYSYALKESAKVLSGELLQTCNLTLSKLKSQAPKSSMMKQKRKQLAHAHSVVRKQVTAAPYDDGHQWRKYGEKLLKGCIFKRSYYRCTYSGDRRCQAKKQVQKQAGTPTLFEVIYEGEHTCNPMSTTDHEMPPSDILTAISPPHDGSFLLHFGSTYS